MDTFKDHAPNSMHLFFVYFFLNRDLIKIWWNSLSQALLPPSVLLLSTSFFYTPDSTGAALHVGMFGLALCLQPPM